MSRPAVSPTDPRNRYGHNSYPISYGGIQMERGVTSPQALLGGSSQMMFSFITPADVATEQIVGDLPYGLIIWGFINHVAIAAGTFKLTLKGVGGGGDTDLITAASGDLTVVGERTLINPFWAPIVNTRPLAMTIVGGTAGAIVRASVLCTPMESPWK